MIRLYKANETNFNQNGDILNNVLDCIITEESNGIFNAEFKFPYNPKFEQGMIITADTPRGEQKFRIVKPKIVYDKSQKCVSFLSRHIFYDLLNNFIENIRPTDKDAKGFLDTILQGTAYTHSFVGMAVNTVGTATANYVRMNPIQAIMGNQDNSVLNIFKADIERDNFIVKVQSGPRERGYIIESGKNLTAIEREIDISDITTRLFVTSVIKENTVITLPEKFVDSKHINNYPAPIIKEYRVELTEDEKKLPITQIYDLMRNRAKAEFENEIDLPKINLKIDFVRLEKSEQFKGIAVLPQLDLNDSVTIRVKELGIDVKAKVIKYTFDGANKRYLKMELGNFKPTLTNQKTEFQKLLMMQKLKFILILQQ